MKRVLILGVLAAVIAGTAFYFLSPRRPRNVIFIMLDTLRADHLGVYGYERATSPMIDRFAKDSVRYRYAITSAPWTPPAIASMFTGKYPSSHGMMPPNARGLAERTSSILSDENVTLAEVFSAHGYQTIGITPNPWISRNFGYAQGFQKYIFEARANAEKINQLALQSLDGVDHQKPFFLFLHYLDPHQPYDPPPPYDKQFTEPLKSALFNYSGVVFKNLNDYDGEIRYLDDRLGELFQKLKERDLWDDSVIVMISDHGEQFLERGETGHGNQLFNEEVHVLFFIKAPTLPPHDVESVVSPVDVFPTLVELASIESPNASVEGISLVDEKALAARQGVLSEIHRNHDLQAFTRKDRKRIILTRASGETEGKDDELKVLGVFDPMTDPREKSFLKDAQLEKELRLDYDSLHERVLNEVVSSKKVDVSEETLEQLKSLGYMK